MTGVLKEAGIDPVYTTKAKKAKLAFKLNAVPSNNNDEAYRLAVMSPDSKKQIVATADARAGLLYALQTLRQMTTPQNGLRDYRCAGFPVARLHAGRKPSFPGR